MPTRARRKSRSLIPIALRLPLFLTTIGILIASSLWATSVVGVGAAPLLVAIVAERSEREEIKVDVFPADRNAVTPAAAPIASPVIVPTPVAPVVVPPPVMPAPVSVASPTRLPANKPAAMKFDNRPIRVARTMRMVVTGYSPDARSCGASADGITASGFSVWTNGMKMVAADTRVLPFNTLVAIPGYNDGKPVPVYDRGGAIKGNRLDLLFPTHEQARRWGRKTMTITVWEYVD